MCDERTRAMSRRAVPTRHPQPFWPKLFFETPARRACPDTSWMDKYVARSTKMEGFHGQKFLHHAHADTLQTELQAAVAYATEVSRSAEWKDCLGKSASATKPTDVLAKMTGPHASDSVMFGGTLSMLDLSDRVKPMDQLDVGRMWWACEVLDQDRSLRRLLGSIVVRADFKAGPEFLNLKRVERDADIDVLCLSIWWHKPASQGPHPLTDLCRDLVFCAQRVGQGLELEVERFKRMQDEEKLRNVLGKSAWRLALDMQNMVKLAEPQRNGMTDANLLSTVLTARKELANWRPDTCQRYLGVADKIDAKGLNILNKWELAFQRGTLVDGITILRSAATAAANPEEMSVLLETLFFEQVCKLRSTVAPRGGDMRRMRRMCSEAYCCGGCSTNT